MYVRNDTSIAILYTIVGGGVSHGTVLPGQQLEIDAVDGAEHISFEADDAARLPESLLVTLAAR